MAGERHGHCMLCVNRPFNVSYETFRKTQWPRSGRPLSGPRASSTIKLANTPERERTSSDTHLYFHRNTKEFP